MSMRAYCDNCGNYTQQNAAADPLSVVRERLEVKILVTKLNSNMAPVVCVGCVRAAAFYGEEVGDES